MGQAARRPVAFDRGSARIAWDLDRAVRLPSPAADLDGLMRALALAVPVSALLWLGCAIAIFRVIR